MEIGDRIHPRGECDPRRYHKCGLCLHQFLMPNTGSVTRHNHSLPRMLAEPFSILKRPMKTSKDADYFSNNTYVIERDYRFRHWWHHQHNLEQFQCLC